WTVRRNYAIDIALGTGAHMAPLVDLLWRQPQCRVAMCGRDNACWQALTSHFSIHRVESRSLHQSHLINPHQERLSVKDFQSLVADFEQKEVMHRDAARRATAEERRERVAELIEQHVSDEGWRGLVRDARQAAENGQKEFLLLRFPAQL